MPNSPSPSEAHTNALEPRVNPPPYKIPLDPRRPNGDHITIVLEEAAKPLATQQIEYCLVALNNLVSRVLQDPTMGGARAFIPPSGYPIESRPRQAMGAYIEIEPGEDGAMRWSTLQLAIWGLWNLMVLQRRQVEVTFTILDERGRYVADGMIAHEEDEVLRLTGRWTLRNGEGVGEHRGLTNQTADGISNSPS
ncbi:MAG: hypothetical protein Q9213_008150 [Squamulea squamosa]